jgi:Tfp pilus assembly protein PilF
MVMKNKEEATELFKDRNFRPAAARYHKALTHSTKFFDLSPEDEKEVKAVKLSLYLNLALCYMKMDNWHQVQVNSEEALAIDPQNAKALFRRCQVCCYLY